MGTVVAQSSVGEPLLATGQAGTTDYTFRQLRQLTQAVGPGVVGANDLKVSAGAGMSVNVATGAGFVEATDDAADRYLYPIPALGSTVNLSGITAPTGATRRDMVVARAYDNGEDSLGTTADAKVQYIKNATETTTAEATPSNAELLAYVDVTVGAGSITSGMITDMRRGCGGQGGAPIAAGMRLAGGTLVSTGTLTKLATTATDLALGGVGLRVDTANQRIYAAAAGLYRVTCSAYVNNGNAAKTIAQLVPYVNGAAATGALQVYHPIVASDQDHVQVVNYLRLTAGQYLELFAASDKASVTHVALNSFGSSLIAERIGA